MMELSSFPKHSSRYSGFSTFVHQHADYSVDSSERMSEESFSEDQSYHSSEYDDGDADIQDQPYPRDFQGMQHHSYRRHHDTSNRQCSSHWGLSSRSYHNYNKSDSYSSHLLSHSHRHNYETSNDDYNGAYRHHYHAAREEEFPYHFHGNEFRGVSFCGSENLGSCSKRNDPSRNCPTKHHGSRTQQERKSPMIEIAPGLRLPLRGAEETTDAIRKHYISPNTCFACSKTIYCIKDAEYFICPSCYVVSPAEQGDRHAKLDGVAIGLTLSDLAREQERFFFQT